MKLSLVTAAASSLLLVALVSSSAAAQEAPPAPPPPPPVVTERTTSQASGPSMAMVGSGVVIFGLSYVPAVVVGSSSGLDADRTMLVPLAGPWLDLTQRPGCSGSGSACNGENTDKILLITDGVFQAIGALTILGGFLTPAHETTTVQATKLEEPTWHITPASVGAGAYGVAAVGTF
jgi:hypothetical protein